MLDIKQLILTGSPVDYLVSILHYVEAKKYLGIPDDFGQTGQTKILKYGVFELFYQKHQLVGVFAYRRHLKPDDVLINNQLLLYTFSDTTDWVEAHNLQYTINYRFKGLGTIEVLLSNNVTITVEADTDVVYNIGRNW